MVLTKDHLAFFKANGYLILPEVLEPELCSQALDMLWSSLKKKSKIKRNDPSTHMGPFDQSDMDGVGVLQKLKLRLKIYLPKPSNMKWIT